MTDSSRKEWASLPSSVSSPATSRGRVTRQVTAHAPWALVLVTSRLARVRVEEAVAREWPCRFVATVGQAYAALRETTVAPGIAILEATDAESISVAPLAILLVEVSPSTAIIGWCKAGAEQSRDILAFAKAGAHELIFEGVPEGARVIRRIVESSRQAVAGADVSRWILPALPACAHSFVDFALRHPEIATVAHLAQALAVHRKTLFVQCKRAHLPPPGTVLGWCRLAIAVHLLRHSHRPVEALALDLGFASANAMRNMLKRYANLRPSDIRNAGDTTVFLEALRRALDGNPGAPGVSAQVA
jgi:AraC-like DNA-binding protein